MLCANKRGWSRLEDFYLGINKINMKNLTVINEVLELRISRTILFKHP